MIARLWRLLQAAERRRALGIVPLLVVSALVEVVGVAAVIPFLALLADPDSVRTLPVVGPWVVASGIEDAGVLLRWAGAALALTLVLANGLVMATQWWLLRFAWSTNHAVASRLVRHYLSQPYAFVLDRNTAELANRVVTVVRQVVENGVRASLNIVSRSVVIVALVAFLVVLNPVTAAVAFATLGSIYGTIFMVSRRYLRRIGKDSVTTGTARLKAVNEALGGFKDLRVAGREAAAYRQFLEPSRRFGEIEAGWNAVATLPRYALEAVAVGGLVLIASLMSATGGVTGTLPLLGAYAFAGLRILPAIQALFGAISRIRFAAGSLDAIEADFGFGDDLEPLTDSEPSAMQYRAAIELRNVHFGYAGADAQALAGVSITITKHRSLAIVGRTGSGKTTLVDVLLGLLTPQSGSVVVDGEPLARDQRRSYRRLFGYVPQSIYLLDDTIERNVAFGLAPHEIDAEAVKRACREAQIADFIESELPQGYATEVGERGVRLSGGQRQRIGIARALYHQPAVLVFDEATSALDVHTEQLVYQALEGIARDRTVVTIAHRLETVAKADHVVVLDRGRVVDQGPPGAVLDRYRGEAVA